MKSRHWFLTIIFIAIIGWKIGDYVEIKRLTQRYDEQIVKLENVDIKVRNISIIHNNIVSKPNAKLCSKRSSNDKFHTENNECICSSKINYPEIEDGDNELGKEINRQIREYISKHKCDLSFEGGNADLAYEVISFYPRLIGFKFVYHHESSDIDAISGVETLNFDVKTSKKVLFSDIINDNNIEEINRYIFKKLKENPDSFYYQAGNEDVEILKSLDDISFYIENNKIIIQFNPNEVGPYSVGIITVDLPISFVNKGYLLEDATR